MPTDRLDRDERRELRDRGWKLRRRKAKRPRSVRRRDVLRIGKSGDLTAEIVLERGCLKLYKLEAVA